MKHFIFTFILFTGSLAIGFETNKSYTAKEASITESYKVKETTHRVKDINTTYTDCRDVSYGTSCTSRDYRSHETTYTDCYDTSYGSKDCISSNISY